MYMYMNMNTTETPRKPPQALCLDGFAPKRERRRLGPRRPHLCAAPACRESSSESRIAARRPFSRVEHPGILLTQF